MASTVSIDRWLETCIRRDACELHLAAWKTPMLCLHGYMREIQTKVLEPEDTMALMKSVTPERILRKFEENGFGDFGLAFGEAGRFSVSVFKENGSARMVLRRVRFDPPA